MKTPRQQLRAVLDGACKHTIARSKGAGPKSKEQITTFVLTEIQMQQLEEVYKALTPDNPVIHPETIG